MTAETKEQALDLVAAIFVRAGERVPHRIRQAAHPAPVEQIEREAA